MQPNIVVLHTAMHTGTVFIREFLALHPAIDGYLSRGETLYANGNYVLAKLNHKVSLKQNIFNIQEAKRNIRIINNDNRFHLIQHHILANEINDYGWSLPAICNHAYLAAYKRIYTTRDPLAAIISLYIRHDTETPYLTETRNIDKEKLFIMQPKVFGDYYCLIKKFPGVIVRIDYPYKGDGYRKEMTSVLDYIGIEKPDYFDEYVNGWLPANISPTHELKKLYLSKDYEGIKKQIPEIIEEFEKYKDIYLDFLCGECNYPKDYFMWA